MENKNILKWVRYSVAFRIAMVAVLALLLLIPVAMIQDLVRERESTKISAVSEIAQKWGEQQTIVGPIITVPYRKSVLDENGKRTVITEYAHFLPETLSVNGTLNPEIRSRGIFDAVVYSSEINLSGEFEQPNLQALGIVDGDVDWNNAFVSIGISDVRGINENVSLVWNKNPIQFEPGIKTSDVIRNSGLNNYSTKPYYGNTGRDMSMPLPTEFKPITTGNTSGLSALIPLNTERWKTTPNTFSFNLHLNGSSDLQFVPVGKTTEVTLTSTWDSPSFSGAFLPDTREISDNGFNASWKIFDLNRGYPQSWTGSSYDVYTSASGVKLLAGIDGYTKTTRSAKYALLIIALTFLVFFFAEILNKKMIHPIQYILVGLALVLFYALLISISEIAGFGLAYLIASVATIALITVYSKSIHLSQNIALLQGGVLAFLYVFIYIILQLEDYALLMGSIFLFLILSAVMYFSRKIDWYAIGNNVKEN